MDGLLPAACDHPATDAYPVGTTTVTCTSTDSHGNIGYGTFRVTVLPYLADLKVSVTGPETSARNTIGRWTVTISNTGPSNATGILLGVTTDGISVTSASWRKVRCPAGARCGGGNGPYGAVARTTR